MNAVLKIFLSMSCSGGFLILTLLLGKRFLKDKISRQWQYYIWLIVVLRLLLPFGPEVSLLGKTYQAVDQAITQVTHLSPQQPMLNTPGDVPDPAVSLEQNHENVNSPAGDLTAIHPFQDIWSLLINHVWLVWLAVALGLLIRKITAYQGFIRYIHAGLTPVSDIELLGRLAIVAEQAGIKKPIELCINPLISSPLLIGFFCPCIVLPNADISKKSFQYIILHELTHYKRLDMFYKWLVQITVCLHWFNPLVYLMSREITKACEFSCDEAVLAKTGSDSAPDYGKTLLDAMAAVGKYKEKLGAVTLNENKQLLKERLGAIMNFRRKSRAIWLLTGALTLCMILGTAFVGVYPAVAASDQSSSKLPVSGKQNPTQAGTSKQSDEFDELEDEKEKEWDAAQKSEYQAAGVTINGKDYYYQGQLVNIFLDIRANKSFYTLNMNPAGTVNIKIIRNADNKITSVACMTEAEVTELLEDMRDDDDDWQENVKGSISIAFIADAS